MPIQLRPRACVVPVNHVPKTGGEHEQFLLESVNYGPIGWREHENDSVLWPMGAMEESNGDVEITFALKADLGASGAMEALLSGPNGEMSLGGCVSGAFPGRKFVFLGGCEEGTPPQCPDDPVEVSVNILREDWNGLIAGGNASLLMTFIFYGEPDSCPGSYIRTTVKHALTTSTEPEYSAPATRRYRTFAPTYIGANGKKRYKWATRRWCRHTGTWGIELVSDTSDPNSSDEHDFISLCGLGVSPREESSIAPGKCVRVFPTEGRLDGSIIGLTGIGECVNTPVP